MMSNPTRKSETALATSMDSTRWYFAAGMAAIWPAMVMARSAVRRQMGFMNRRSSGWGDQLPAESMALKMESKSFHPVIPMACPFPEMPPGAVMAGASSFGGSV